MSGLGVRLGTPQPAFTNPGNATDDLPPRQHGRYRDKLASKVDVDYYTHTTGRSAFWCAFTAPKPDGGFRVAVNFGSIGSEGQTQVKDFPSRNQALAFVQKKINEKEGKGYDRRIDMEQSERIVAKGEALLDLPKPQAPPPPPRTANLLEVCESAVATAVDAVTSDGALSVEEVNAVHAARDAWSELRSRFSELESHMELIDAMFGKKMGD